MLHSEVSILVQKENNSTFGKRCMKYSVALEYCVLKSDNILTC